ncbi:MAG: hypothetical protein C4582_09095 [Desulfobacteraceae bacterium]|jgi:hypothetical protein|nr:MAG: hypothetical protein C4582_09095 [Desulfobacteraceae bacterium]
MQEKAVSVRCIACGRFRYFENKLGHNSPSALGICTGEPWDGNRGQWPVLFHPCKAFIPPVSEKSAVDTGKGS